jgi:hypothetical protein
MIKAYTGDPDALLNSLKDGIRIGGIRSWSLDKDGDFRHEAAQVKGVCYFRPKVLDGELRFTFGWITSAPETAEARAELHAHGVRMLMMHGPSVTSIEVPTT